MIQTKWMYELVSSKNSTPHGRALWPSGIKKKHYTWMSS